MDCWYVSAPVRFRGKLDARGCILKWPRVLRRSGPPPKRASSPRVPEDFPEDFPEGFQSISQHFSTLPETSQKRRRRAAGAKDSSSRAANLQGILSPNPLVVPEGRRGEKLMDCLYVSVPVKFRGKRDARGCILEWPSVLRRTWARP